MGDFVVRVEGLRELLRVIDLLPKDVQREIKKELREVAEPVRAEAQRLFLSTISPDVRKTRYGISVRKVGTITVEQRVRSKNRAFRFRRPKFTDLVLKRSLDPAVDRNQQEIRAGFNRVLDSLERRWSVG